MFTTTISVITPNAPYQTRFSTSMRLLLSRILNRGGSRTTPKDEDQDDLLREECVTWVLNTATIPSTIRIVCRAIAMLPTSQLPKEPEEDLHDWNVVVRYFRTIVTSGVVSTDVAPGTLPSVLEVLYQLIISSTTPLTSRDSTIILQGLISILPGRLYNEPSSGKWILMILVTIGVNDPIGFRRMISDLHQAVGRLAPANRELDTAGIIDQFLLLLRKAVELKQLDLALKIADLLRRATDHSPSGLELEQEANITVFVTLLEDQSFTRFTSPTDTASLLTLASSLIRRVIHYRGERLSNNQNTSIITPEAAGVDARLQSTLRVLQKLLRDHKLDNHGWEVDLLAIFRSSLNDLETSVSIIQVLAILAPSLSAKEFERRDITAFETFLAQSSAIGSAEEWISASMLVLFYACKKDAAAVADLLKTSAIPEETLSGLFLTAYSTTEMEIQRTARLEISGKWLRAARESQHKRFRSSGWSGELKRYGETGVKDVYLKVLKDILSCLPHLWYSQVVADSHLEVLAGIMLVSDDDNNCDWMACFLFMGLWRWHWSQAVKYGADTNVQQLFDRQIVRAVTHFFISSRKLIKRWDIDHYGSNLEDIATLTDTVLAASSYLQAAASAGLIPQDNAEALNDGYRRWVMSILNYLKEVDKDNAGLELWHKAHDADGTLFRELGDALMGYENKGRDSNADAAQLQENTPATAVTYVIRCVHSRTLLHATLKPDEQAPGGQVVIYRDLGTPNQKWTLIPASPGTFLIRNVSSNTYLNYQKSSSNDLQVLKDGTQFVTGLGDAPVSGAVICCDSLPAEWLLKKAGDTEQFQLILPDFPELAIDLWGMNKSDGSQLIFWPSNGQTNQLWTLEPVSE
ncbi:hypothetical protein FRC02_004073 [Tulasnella sp. 418]|nr:hypothetical protein FRC02_004073 [Tulasnella sp. 418]